MIKTVEVGAGGWVNAALVASVFVTRERDGEFVPTGKWLVRFHSASMTSLADMVYDTQDHAENTVRRYIDAMNRDQGD